MRIVARWRNPAIMKAYSFLLKNWAIWDFPPAFASSASKVSVRIRFRPSYSIR